MSGSDNIIYDDEEEENQEYDILDLISQQSSEAEKLGKPKDLNSIKKV